MCQSEWGRLKGERPDQYARPIPFGVGLPMVLAMVETKIPAEKQKNGFCTSKPQQPQKAQVAASLRAGNLLPPPYSSRS
jgi:hypothetical protein